MVRYAYPTLNPETVSDNGLLLKPEVESLAPELACDSCGDEALRLLSHGHSRTPIDLLKRQGRPCMTEEGVPS